MASNPEFVQYIADQLAPAGQVTYHKMFGDYGVYLDGKMFAWCAMTSCSSKLPKRGQPLLRSCPKPRRMMVQKIIFCTRMWMTGNT